MSANSIHKHDYHPTTHELKCWIQPFRDIVAGTKTSEYRNNDRKFKLGDYLLLKEYDHTKQILTGNTLTVQITHIQRGFGIPENYCMMSISTKLVYDNL